MKKSDFKVLGTITHMATNGLMVFSNGKSTGQISDGKIGDVVVRRKDETGLEVQIFSAEEWASMEDEETKGKKNVGKGKKAEGKDEDTVNASQDENVLNLSNEAAKEGE
jgi:hypothetical protein